MIESYWGAFLLGGAVAVFATISVLAGFAWWYMRPFIENARQAATNRSKPAPDVTTNPDPWVITPGGMSPRRPKR
jgi:hypothetical protein